MAETVPAVPRRAAPLEIIVVLAATVGTWLVMAVRELLRPGVRVPTFHDRDILETLAFEAVAAAVLLPWLAHRGWRLREVVPAPVPLDVARGLMVWLLGMGCLAIPWTIFAAREPALAQLLAEGAVQGRLSAPVIVVGAVLNGLFEEFLWLAYVIPALAPRVGMRWACAASVLLRTSVHVYQGPTVLLGVLPFAIGFTWYYARTGRVWPVVVAHVVSDAIAFATLHEPGR